MKASELRIGNLVMDENYNLVTITHEDFMGVNDDGGFPLRPIPLTEEWLVKFGFEKEEDIKCLVNGEYKFNYWHKEELMVILGRFEDGTMCIVEDGICLSNDIKYIHQLQNLYFALTGTELTLQK